MDSEARVPRRSDREATLMQTCQLPLVSVLSLNVVAMESLHPALLCPTVKTLEPTGDRLIAIMATDSERSSATGRPMGQRGNTRGLCHGSRRHAVHPKKIPDSSRHLLRPRDGVHIGRNSPPPVIT